MKISKILFLLLFFSFLSPIFAQNSISVSKNLFKIDFIEPGFTYERGLTKRSTLFTEVAVQLSFSSNDYGTDFYVEPVIVAEYRFYYNLEKRARKGKNISRNSGNFIGANVAYFFPPFGHENENYNGDASIATFWGMQRTYKKGFNLGLQGGVAFDVSENFVDGFYPYLRLTIGIVLGKKK